MSRNLFKQFINLIPNPPLEAGEVLSIDSGIATVELPGGGLITARGAATVGQQVFVRDGVIEGAATLLPIELIEV